MSYSQNNEEHYITEYFRDKLGKFIDIGAFHPFIFSNTRKLYELGWKGIFVEPAPSLFKLFEDEYGGNTDVTLLNIAVGDTTDHVKLYESEGDALSSTNEEQKVKWNIVTFKEIMVPMLETVAFFNQYGQDVDFINLDTEGTNMVIFRLIPDWVWNQIKMICIEHDECYYEIKGKLSDFGFRELYRNAENIILCK